MIDVAKIFAFSIAIISTIVVLDHSDFKKISIHLGSHFKFSAEK
jgi:hypothetical protein